MPLFTGGKGIGKSDMLEALLPYGWVRYFSLKENEVEMARAIGKNPISYINELAGMKKSSYERIKSFITQSTSFYRRMYREDYTDQPRRGIVVADSNDAEPLPVDDDGQRRWAVIKVARKQLDADITPGRLIEASREQLYAEALHRYRAGERANPDPETERLIRLSGTAAQDVNMMLSDYIDAVTNADGKLLLHSWDTGAPDPNSAQWFSLPELKREIERRFDGKPVNFHQREWRRELLRRGYQRKRIRVKGAKPENTQRWHRN